MKVCHITSAHSPFDVRIFHKECQSLVRAGYDVMIIAPADFKERVVEGIRVLGVSRPTHRRQRVRVWREIVECVRHLKPDVVHFHDPDLLLVTPLLGSYRLIYDCHERNAPAMLTKFWLPKPLRRPFSLLTSLLEPALANRVDAIILVDDSQTPTFQKTGKPLFLVRNFPLMTLDTSHRSNNAGKKAIHVGAHAESRGCRVMIEAIQLVARQITGAKLLLVGPFNHSPYEAEIRKMIADRGLENTVEMIGEVPYTDIPDWIGRASVGLVAIQPVLQHQGGIPTKMFEYMASGIPVIAGDIPPTRRFMASLDCGFLVEPAAPQEYAAAIAHLFTHPEEGRRLGENGRKAVVERYNWNQEAQKLLSAYAFLQNPSCEEGHRQ